MEGKSFVHRFIDFNLILHRTKKNPCWLISQCNRLNVKYSNENFVDSPTLFIYGLSNVPYRRNCLLLFPQSRNEFWYKPNINKYMQLMAGNLSSKWEHLLIDRWTLTLYFCIFNASIFFVFVVWNQLFNFIYSFTIKLHGF